MTTFSPKGKEQQGFTLLEVIIVIGIMAMLAAMLYPAAGLLDNKERARITEEKMEEIRRAMLGDPDRFDEHGRRIIGGYVGDMEAWPGLWEAAPEVRGHVTPPAPAFNENDAGNLATYLYRPTGRFSKNGWRWHTPYRRLSDDTTNYLDHIGGLETENEGQPRGLWTNDVDGQGTADLDSRWKGPYLLPPTDSKPADGDHLAKTAAKYEELEPLFESSSERWEDGDYNPSSGEPGEHYDDKEDFRLLQNHGRLEDGWQRSLRFFITADPDHPGATLFWIISEGPDHEGTYPSKGTYNGASWGTPDANDIMSQAYDENDDYNKDNIVMKISSRQWQSVLEANNSRKAEETRTMLLRLRQALVGKDLPLASQFNSGYTGSLCAWPALFNWEATSWDDQNGSATDYSKGQPRGLWTSSPNSTDSSDDLAMPSLTSPGLGWFGPYIEAPVGHGQDEALLDAWGRPLLFFRDDSNNRLLIISRGADNLYDFGDPANLVEAMDVTTYNPAAPGNEDNVVSEIRPKGWSPGWFTLENLRVYNASSGITKAAFYDGLGSPTIHSAGVLTDEDGDLAADDWALGGPATNEAFSYDAGSADQVCLGRRQLLVWNDSNSNNQLDSGETYTLNEYSVAGHGGLEPRQQLIVDSSTFAIAP